MTTTVGADPELFFTSLDLKGQCISAIGRVGGSKEQPLSIGKGCAVQEDNVAAEFCIPPATTADEFISSIKYAVGYLAALAQDNNLALATGVSAHSFLPAQLRDPAAKVFGCDPDYNAWTLAVNPRPECKDQSLRSAGGHVHVGTEKHPAEVIKAMDLFLGVPSITVDPDQLRRQLYGKAGAHRPKPYGVEYRTLSNFWIWNRAFTKWVFDQTLKAEAFAEKYVFTKEDEEMITTCINKTDFKLQTDILNKFKKHKISVPSLRN